MNLFFVTGRPRIDTNMNNRFNFYPFVVPDLNRLPLFLHWTMFVAFSGLWITAFYRHMVYPGYLFEFVDGFFKHMIYQGTTTGFLVTALMSWFPIVLLCLNRQLSGKWECFPWQRRLPKRMRDRKSPTQPFANHRWMEVIRGGSALLLLPPLSLIGILLFGGFANWVFHGFLGNHVDFDSALRGVKWLLFN